MTKIVCAKLLLLSVFVVVVVAEAAMCSLTPCAIIHFVIFPVTFQMERSRKKTTTTNNSHETMALCSCAPGMLPKSFVLRVFFFATLPFHRATNRLANYVANKCLSIHTSIAIENSSIIHSDHYNDVYFKSLLICIERKKTSPSINLELF